MPLAAGHRVIQKNFRRFDRVIIGDGEHRVSITPAWFRIGGRRITAMGVNRKFTRPAFAKILA
jgi:hypothetical protein